MENQQGALLVVLLSALENSLDVLNAVIIRKLMSRKEQRNKIKRLRRFKRHGVCKNLNCFMSFFKKNCTLLKLCCFNLTVCN